MTKQSLKQNKALLPVLIGVLAICFVWIAYQLFFSGPSVPRVGKEPTDAVAVETKDLNEKLKADKRFETLEVVRNDDGSWACTGAIRLASDVPALKDKLNELKPGTDWRVEVEPMNPR